MKKREPNPKHQPKARLGHLLGTARARVARDPALDAIAREIEGEAQKLLKGGELKQMADAVFKRKLPLDGALLGLARRVDAVLQEASISHRKVIANEEKLDARLRQELERRLVKAGDVATTTPAPAGENDYVISGQVIHPTTKEPVPGMVVQASERDATRDERSRPAITNHEGKFRIVVSLTDLRTRDKEPELTLLVGADRASVVPFKDVRVLLSRERPEELTLTLPEESLNAAASLGAAPGRVDVQRLDKVHRAQSLRRVQGPLIQQATALLRRELGSWITSIEKKGKPTGEPAGDDAAPDDVPEETETRVEGEPSPTAPPADAPKRAARDTSPPKRARRARKKARKPKRGKRDD